MRERLFKVALRVVQPSEGDLVAGQIVEHAAQAFLVPSRPEQLGCLQPVTAGLAIPLREAVYRASGPESTRHLLRRTYRTAECDRFFREFGCLGHGLGRVTGHDAAAGQG